MNNIIYTKKLSQDTNYVRPTKTITELLQTENDILEQLKYYDEISEDDLNFISIGTALRYIGYDKQNNCEIFRFGGILTKIAREYIVLAGKEGMKFSAQRYSYDGNNNIIHTTRFFRKKKVEDFLNEKINDTNDIIEKQSNIIEKQRQELLAMKKKLKNSKG